MLVQVFFLLTFQDSCEGQLSQFLFFFCHFFFFLPFVGYTSPIDRHGWQMIWSLLTICTRNPVLLHRSDISISISVNMFQNSKIVKILKSTRDNFIVLQFHNVIRSQIFHTSQHHVTCFKPLLLRLNNFWPERGCYPYSQWVLFPVHDHLFYESFSDVGEIRVWFASKILTPIGESRPFGRENLFRPKKTPKNSHF